MEKKLKLDNFLIFVFLLLLSLIAAKPLLRQGFFSSHDGLVHLVNLGEFRFMFKQGQFPVRWGADFDFGYGNPFFNFYSPLLNYLALPLTFVFGYLWSLKIILVLGFFISGLFAFLLAREFWGKWGGLLSGVSYIFFPYRFLEIYVRGAFPEFLALSLLPFVLWSFYKLLKSENKFYFYLAPFSLAALLLSHNFISFVFFPVLILFLGGAFYSLFLGEFRKLARVLTALILGFGLSLFFLLPTLGEKKYLITLVEGEVFKPWVHFLDFSRLWDCQWGFEFPAEGSAGTMCFQLGKINLLLALFSLILFFNFQKNQRFFIVFSLILVVGGIFLVLPFSGFLWEKIAYLSYGQFPWRFLTLVGLGLALAGGGSVFFFREEREKMIFALGGSLLLVFLSLGFLKPQNYFSLKDENFANVESIRRFFVGRAEEKGVLYLRETLPLWVINPPQDVPKKKIEGEDKLEIEEVKISPIFYLFKTKGEGKIKINTFYFPGWKVLVDGREKEIEIGDDGTINFSVSSGEHEVKVFFDKTEVRKIGEMASLGSFFLVFLLGFLL